MKKHLRILSLALGLVMILAALAGCGAAEEPTNSDGEIGTRKESSGGSGLFSKSKDAVYESAELPSESGRDYYMESEGIDGKIDVGAYDGTAIDDAIDRTAGTLTGSEWCDNDHWKDFTSKLEGQDADTAGWMGIAKKWRLVATNRLHVHVVNGEKAVALARAELLDGNGKTLWNAVSDNNGDAYLFWNTNPYEQSATPVSVKVTAKDGTTEVKNLDGVNPNKTLEITLNAANGQTKLDLLLMIDTTGSMGDELEYLKIELEDVVKRVKETCQINVRTSVNFYRDEGDDYVVRYFGFKEDLSDAVANLQAQSANGGGDYPEAVHTALDNAVNGHAWNEDAVKLMILVLDAPPHDDESVIESIGDSVAKAAAEGIRIIPVASSGIDEECQVLFRTFAAVTGGTYTYLTDHSGIGNSHEKQDVEEETVEFLNDMLVRIVSEYCTVK